MAKTETQDGSGDNTVAQMEAESIKPGDEGTLKAVGDQGPTLAWSDESWRDFLTVIDARDTDGLKLLLQKGEVSFVPAGTKVRVIKTNLIEGASLVRVLEGSHKYETGWTFSQLIRVDHARQ